MIRMLLCILLSSLRLLLFASILMQSINQSKFTLNLKTATTSVESRGEPKILGNILMLGMLFLNLILTWATVCRLRDMFRKDRVEVSEETKKKRILGRMNSFRRSASSKSGAAPPSLCAQTCHKNQTCTRAYLNT